MYVSDTCVLLPFPAHLFKRGWPRDPNATLHLFSSPTLFTEEFSLPKSANLTRGLGLDWILHFGSSRLHAHLSKTHFTWVEIL